MGRGGDTTAPDTQGRSCPSAPAAPGSTLLGVLGADGRIHNLRTAMTVDQDFLDAAGSRGPVEARMRFAGRCQTSGCAQWTGTRCGVIDRAMAHLEAAQDLPDATSLPPCVIRTDCRWFDQRGPAACATCSLIVTDTSGAMAAE
jgi:hypothetical protein